MSQLDSGSFAFLCAVAAARQLTGLPAECHEAAVYEALEQRSLHSAIQYLVGASSDRERPQPRRFVVGSRSVSRSCVVAEEQRSSAGPSGTLPCCRISVSVSASPLPSAPGAPSVLMVRVEVTAMWLKLTPLRLELSAHLSRRLATRGVAEADDDSDAFGDPNCIMFPELEPARISAVFAGPPGLSARGQPQAVLPAEYTDSLGAAAQARFVESFDVLARPAVNHDGGDTPQLPWVALGAVLDDDDDDDDDVDECGMDAAARASLRARGLRPITSVCRSFQLRDGAEAPPTERERCARFAASVSEGLLAHQGLSTWFPCEEHQGILSPDSLTAAALSGFVSARMLPQSSVVPPNGGPAKTVPTETTTTTTTATTTHEAGDMVKAPVAHVAKKKPRAAGKARAAKAR